MSLTVALLLGLSTQAVDLQPLSPPPAGKARLVFYRSGAFFSGARGCSAYLEQGGKPLRVAKLGRSQYAVHDAEPGTRVLSGSKSLKRPVVAELVAGRTTFVRCEVPGMTGVSRLAMAHRVEFDHYAPGLDPAR